MMNFPNNPTDGERVELEGAWWEWRADRGCWIIAPVSEAAPIQIIEESYSTAGFGKSYVVIGSFMLAWGYKDRTSTNGQTLTFPKAFSAPPCVIADGNDTTYTGAAYTITATNCVQRCWGDGGSVNVDCLWHALGRA